MNKTLSVKPEETTDEAITIIDRADGSLGEENEDLFINTEKVGSLPEKE
jgi:hypothetical protein